MRSLIILLIISIGIISCEENDPGSDTIDKIPNIAADPNLEAVSKTETIGELELTSIYEKSAQVHSYFGQGEVTWNFGESTVIINNTNKDDSKEDSFDSGEYDYSLEDSNQMGVSNLFVDGQNLGLFYYENGHDSLTVFSEQANGLILNFLRNP